MTVTNEATRQAAVDRYAILDTPPDGTFDSIASLAARIFEVPIAIVSIVDRDRIWFKSHHGLDVEQVERTPGLCASVILAKDPYILTDAKVDPRSLANPLVAGEFGLRFYAAAPLVTKDNHSLGTLCVIDKQPREVTESEMRVLQDLAAIVVDELDLRRGAKELDQIRQALYAKTLEQKADAEQRFRQAFDNAPIGMALLAPDLQIIEVNAAFCEMFGVCEVDILLTDITAAMRPDDPLACLAAFATLHTDVRTARIDLRCTPATAQPVWSRISLAAVVDTAQQPVRFIVQVENITAHKLARAG